AFAGQVVPLGRLHTKLFQIHLNSLDASHPDAVVSIPDTLLSELDWWLSHLSDGSPIFPLIPTQFVVTDASNIGCSAVINGSVYATVWRDYQLDWSINLKELFALTHFLKQNLSLLSNSVI